MNRRKTHMPKRSNKLRIIVAMLCLLAGVAVYLAYQIFGPTSKAFSDKNYFYIHTGSTYQDVIDGLTSERIVTHPDIFSFVAKQLDYPENVKAGRYQIKKGMSNFEIVRMLRNGRQVPVRLVINKLRTRADFCRLIGKNLEADSASVQHLLHDNIYLRQFGLDTNTVMCAIMPNTYEFFWNTTATKAFEKLQKEYDKFWTSTRKDKARDKGLSPNEAIILASIIEEETNKNDEKPVIASVYLNRLRKGWKLGADPTVKFALQDFGLRRIYNKHLEYPSPYNTYYVKGLPPGPICTPSKASIDAVLNAVNSDYMYFSAKSDFSGYHDFAVSWQEHLSNARKYHKALENRNIR